MMKNKAISGGWRGHIQGHIAKTNSRVAVKQIALDLDSATAYGLCNILTNGALHNNVHLEDPQIEQLRHLGAAIGRLIDHPAANNLETQVKP